MKIKISDLRDFLKKSNKIKSNGVIPIHDYLFIECDREAVSITKNNGNMCVKHTVEEDNNGIEKYLVEEKRLSGVVANAKGEFVTIKTQGKKTILKDDVNEVKLEAMEKINVDAFQQFPQAKDEERTTIGPDVLSALFEARNFASIVESNLHYIYVTKQGNEWCVFSTNQHLMYERKFSEPLPDLALSPEVCAIISQFQHVVYYTAGNYDFFDTGKTVYGFIKTTYKCIDYERVIKSLDLSQTITVDRKDLLSFCELVNSLSQKAFAEIKFDDMDEAVMVHFDESEYNTETERKLDVSKNYWPKPFALNCGYLTQVLKCFTTDEVIFSPGPNEKIYGLAHPEEIGLTILICPLMYK